MTAVSPTAALVPPSIYSRDPTLPNGGYPNSMMAAQIQQSLDKRNSGGSSIRRKSVPNSPVHERQGSYPLNDIDEMSQHDQYPPPDHIRGAVRQFQQQLPQFSDKFSNTRVTSLQSIDSRDLQSPSPDLMLNRPDCGDPQFRETLPSPSLKAQHIIQENPMPQPQSAIISSGESNRSSKSSSNFYVGGTESPISASSSSSREDIAPSQKPTKLHPQLNYHHQLADSPSGSSQSLGDPNGAPYSRNSPSPASDEQGHRRSPSGGQHLAPHTAYRKSPRPTSTYSLDARGRSSPNLRAVSGHSYDSRRSSYMDLTQPAHIEQQYRPVSSFDNSYLQAQVGAYASLLSSRETLEKYRATAKKTQDPVLQYEFALFLIQVAQQQQDDAGSPDSAHGRTPGSSHRGNHPYNNSGGSRKELLREARAILERTSSKLPQAQYYLADAFSSGLFNKGREENEKAFPLFIAASKRGHAEAGYRAALCNEFGWGCRKDPLKAVQFYRTACSKSHPGAMTRLGIACLRSDLGLDGRYREGVKWLKRASDIADVQYPSAPYELGLLHEEGFGDSVLEDKAYSAQLFTKAAELGHTEACYRMGDAYEHGKLNCPKDPALSVHFYTEAAQRGLPMAMMALCAWYLCGAEPMLPRNEPEAYAWAVKACEYGTLQTSSSSF